MPCSRNGMNSHGCQSFGKSGAAIGHSIRLGRKHELKTANCNLFKSFPSILRHASFRNQRNLQQLGINKMVVRAEIDSKHVSCIFESLKRCDCAKHCRIQRQRRLLQQFQQGMNNFKHKIHIQQVTPPTHALQHSRKKRTIRCSFQNAKISQEHALEKKKRRKQENHFFFFLRNKKRNLRHLSLKALHFRFATLCLSFSDFAVDHF